MLRAPDVRISHVDTEIVIAVAPFAHVVEASARSVFAFALAGDFEIEIHGRPHRRRIAQGTAIGIEDGRRHVWHALLEGSQSSLLIGAIPRSVSILQRLSDGIIVVPPDAAPFADVIRMTVMLHATVAALPVIARDDAVIRRCAEICLIQFVNYARASLADAPAGLAHDEKLLCAWTAYFADPQRKWTVKALADAAGLGRTAFTERFRAAFGTPPLQTLTNLRLEQAEQMLRGGTASLIEIAFTVGYNSEAAFVRAFHRRYGMPPGRFRAERAASCASIGPADARA